MLPGHILRNRYKIINLLGSGSFGITYLAEDLDLPERPLCVVKNLRQSQSQEELKAFIAFFDKEAKALYRLGNEYNQIPRLFAHFEEEGQFYLVQEYIDGHDLSQEIVAGNQLSEAKVTQLLKEILEVLTVIHNKNIIHRDIKTQNLMRRNSDGKIILIDFGTVKELSQLKVNPQEKTSASVVVGTYGYMPSEQLNGYPKLSSDVYAVGMLGIYALTGIRPQELPKDPNTFEVIWQDHVSVSPKLANVLEKMVRSNFKERYQNAGEALQALTAASSYLPLHFFVPAQRFLIGVGAAVSLIFGMGLLFMSFSRPPATNVSREPATNVATPPTTNVPRPPATNVATPPTTEEEICPEIDLGSIPTKSPDLVNPQGDRYYGELKNGRYHGCGLLIFANGDKYEGEFKQNRFHGQGTLIFKLGNRYEGEFKEGKFHGQGTFTFKSGTRYVGQFKNNVFDGTGILEYKSGCRYEGEFKENKRHGEGTCTSQNGTSESGIWDQGKLNGQNQICCDSVP